MTNQLTFNKNQVRNSFKSRLCGEFILPSGKQSGFYKFPITDEEINDFMKDYNETPKPKEFLTWSEWALWTSLRCKYGVNYLKPKKQVFAAHIDALYAEPQKDDSLEDKLLAYCDGRMGEMMDIILQKSAPEKNEKNFRLSLDNGDFDAIIDSEQEQKTTKGEANE